MNKAHRESDPMSLATIQRLYATLRAGFFPKKECHADQVPYRNATAIIESIHSMFCCKDESLAVKNA